MEPDTASEGIVSALSSIKSNADFQLPTVEAATAISVATSLLSWAAEKEANKAALLEFGESLVSRLKMCVSSSTYNRKTHDSTEPALNHQQYWKRYHQLICSTELRRDWGDFLAAAVGTPPCAQLQQAVMQKLCDEAIRVAFPGKAATGQLQHGDVLDLNMDEEETLRYASGYVMKRVREEVQKKPERGKSLAVISDLTSLDPDSHCSFTNGWTHMIDRGGLTYVNSNCYRLFHSIEMETRRFFRNAQELQYTNILKTDILKSVLSDIDVQYNWSLCSEELDAEEKSLLLTNISRIYLQMRGFSFVRAFMETFKQQQKKGTQKSKALRKKMK